MLESPVVKDAHSDLVGHHLLDLLSTGTDYAMYTYTKPLMPCLDMVLGGLRSTIAISDVELFGSVLPETRSMQYSDM
jgi:hypothetical protein